MRAVKSVFLTSWKWRMDKTFWAVAIAKKPSWDCFQGRLIMKMPDLAWHAGSVPTSCFLLSNCPKLKLLCLRPPQIRMQAQGNLIQGSMMGNFINIYQEEGTRGLWKVQWQRSLKHCVAVHQWPQLTRTNLITPTGRLSHRPAGRHRGRSGAARLRHHKEAPDLVRVHGGHRVHTLLVSVQSHMHFLSPPRYCLSRGNRIRI